MAKLSAIFSIDLEFPIIVECKDEDHYLYSLDHCEYHVDIELQFMDGSPKRGYVDSDLFKKLVNKIEITVTRDVEDIPVIPTNEMGGSDFTKVSGYFKNLTKEYSDVAETYYKNLIRIVKFDLKQPFHDEDNYDCDCFSNPRWSIVNGDYIGTVGFYHRVKVIPGMCENNLGAKPLRINQKQEVETKLKVNACTELYQEILSDAQAAVFNGDIRRAVFEMAIVCELSTKRKYFNEGGISGLAFDYFEDKGKIKVTVLELISSVAEEALGESFKKHLPNDYVNIDYLFRCRNKVAHRGQVAYKDDSSNLIRPNHVMVKKWFSSVEALLSWLSSK